MRGYIVLIVIIILSAILSWVVFSSINKFLEQKANLNNLQLRSFLRSSAEACLQIALLKLKMDQNYMGNEQISVDNLTCQILPIETTQNTYKIKAKASSGQLSVLKFVELNKSDFGIISFGEN